MIKIPQRHERTDGRTDNMSRGKYDDIQSHNTRLKDGVEWFFLLWPNLYIWIVGKMMKVISATKNINDFGEKIDVKSNWIETTFLTSYLQRLWYPYQVFRYFTYLFICIIFRPSVWPCCTFDVVLPSFTSHNCICFRFCLFDHTKNFVIMRHLLHAVGHGLHVDCNVSDDGFRVRNIYLDDLISTASHAADKRWFFC